MTDDFMLVDGDTADWIIAELTKQLHVINLLKRDNAVLMSDIRAAYLGDK